VPQNMEGGLTLPHDAVVWREHLLVTDTCQHCIWMFRLDVKPGVKKPTKWTGGGKFRFPMGLYAMAGMLYVCCEGNPNVRVFRLLDRSFVEDIATGVECPSGVVVTNQHVFVASTMDDFITVLNREGEFEKKIKPLVDCEKANSGGCLALGGRTLFCSMGGEIFALH